mmetsp:Transcript_5440/g.15915  ORF Transcript_5440/g.15915 Transcript_5440/m.15915 type:complete len:411 (+) Transcript_5440:46-1278(+)
MFTARLSGMFVRRACSAAAAVAAGSGLALHMTIDAPTPAQKPALCAGAAPPGLGPGDQLVMSGDCGGTNTRLELFRVPANAQLVLGDKPPGERLFNKTYQNHQFASFQAVVETFLAEAPATAGGARPAACCLACAGGIVDNTVTFTNVEKGWSIDGAALARATGIPRVQLINDFEAQGYGLLTLRAGEKLQLNTAAPRPGSPIACVGAGTGLGECFLTSTKGEYTCFPSEGGHVEFAPRDELAADLLKFLKRKFEQNHRVSVERVISGPGLGNVYEFLRQHWAYADRRDPDLDSAFLSAPEHAKGALVAKGAARGDVLCAKAVHIFSESYGSEVGCVALKFLPYGGLYISGGIAAKNPQWVTGEAFSYAYKDKGRMSPLLDKVPLYLVTVEDTGERGALYKAIALLTEAV